MHCIQNSEPAVSTEKLNKEERKIKLQRCEIWTIFDSITIYVFTLWYYRSAIIDYVPKEVDYQSILLYSNLAETIFSVLDVKFCIIF